MRRVDSQQAIMRRRTALRRLRAYGPTGALIVVLSMLIAFVFYAKPYRVSSGSMAPTAMVGQRIVADHLGDQKWHPKVGQVIVFKAPGGAKRDSGEECAIDRKAGTACLTPIPGRTSVSFVKRVVGLPGDRLRILHGHVIRNGRSVDEPYARSCDDEVCNIPEFTVPQAGLFVMGDNRGDSSDSRFWGPVPRAQVIGRVFGSYWPLSRFGRL